MRQTPVNDYLEEISTKLPEEIYGRLSDAIYETTCDFDEEAGLLKAENAKLRQELAIRKVSEQEKVIEYLRQENIDWEDKYRALASENAKLCELVRWMYDRMDESCAVQHPYAPAPISYDRLMQAQARACELGVEVD